MKKLSIIAIACGLISLASCSSDNEEVIDSNVKVHKTFSAGYSSVSVDAETRIVVNSMEKLINDGYSKFNWNPLDVIEVFPATQQGKGDNYMIEESSINNPDTHVASFSGYSVNANKYYLLYPYQENATLITGSDPRIKARIPHEQDAWIDTFDPAAALQVCSTEDIENQTIILKNVCAFLYIQLPAGVNKVEVKSGKDGWYCAGEVLIEASSGSSAIKSFVSGEQAITLSGVNGVPGYYVICVASSTAFPSLETTVYYNNGQKVSRTAKTSRQFNAGYFYSLGVAPDLNPKNEGIGADAGGSEQGSGDAGFDGGRS